MNPDSLLPVGNAESSLLSPQSKADSLPDSFVNNQDKGAFIEGAEIPPAEVGAPPAEGLSASSSDEVKVQDLEKETDTESIVKSEKKTLSDKKKKVKSAKKKKDSVSKRNLGKGNVVSESKAKKKRLKQRNKAKKYQRKLARKAGFRNKREMVSEKAKSNKKTSLTKTNNKAKKSVVNKGTIVAKKKIKNRKPFVSKKTPKDTVQSKMQSRYKAIIRGNSNTYFEKDDVLMTLSGQVTLAELSRFLNQDERANLHIYVQAVKDYKKVVSDEIIDKRVNLIKIALLTSGLSKIEEDRLIFHRTVNKNIPFNASGLRITFSVKYGSVNPEGE